MEINVAPSCRAQCERFAEINDWAARCAQKEEEFSAEENHRVVQEGILHCPSALVYKDSPIDWGVGNNREGQCQAYGAPPTLELTVGQSAVGGIISTVPVTVSNFPDIDRTINWHTMPGSSHEA